MPQGRLTLRLEERVREKEAQYAALLDPRRPGAFVLAALALAVLLHAALLGPGILQARVGGASQPTAEPGSMLLASLPPPPARAAAEAPPSEATTPPAPARTVVLTGADPVQPPFPAIDLAVQPPEVEILPGEPESVEPAPPPSRASANATQPVLIPSSRVEPSYPEIARRGSFGATVWLRALVLANGTVGEVTVLRSSHPNLGFEAAATRAIRQWRYEPAVRDGRPVDDYVYVHVIFRPK
jgi:protein TonB